MSLAGEVCTKMATIGNNRKASATAVAKTNATTNAVCRTALLLRGPRDRLDPRQEAGGDQLRLSGLAQHPAHERPAVALVAARCDDAHAVSHLGLLRPGGHLDHRHLSAHGPRVGRVDEARVRLG